jgi:hypothetical protein
MEVATPLSSRYIKRSGHVERISSSNSPRRFPLPSVSRSVAWSDFFPDAIRVVLKHFSIYYGPLMQSLNHAFALSAVMNFRESAMACSRASLLLA